MNLTYWIVLLVLLLAEIALATLFVLEKRRSNQRYNAMINYVDCSTDGVASNCEDSTQTMIEEHAKKLTSDILTAVNQTINEQDTKIQNQLKTLLLDYSQAQAAASRINDFGASLASIFDYDPMKAIQKGREKEAR
jgi:hypothetical protein